MLGFLLKGIGIGFSIAAPVGPIGVLCIRRALAHRFWIAFATGLGAATADATYGFIAAFGLTAISGFLVNQKFWLGLIGGAFLIYLGIRTFMSKPSDKPAPSAGEGLVSAYLSTFILTLTNPMTIFSFIAIFAGFGLGASPDYTSAAVVVAGVFVGSAAWWLILSGTMSLLRKRLNLSALRIVNRISGLVIFAFGIYALVGLTRSR